MGDTVDQDPADYCVVYGRKAALSILTGQDSRSERPRLRRSLSVDLPRDPSLSSLKNAGDPEVGGHHRTNRSGRQRLRSVWWRRLIS